MEQHFDMTPPPPKEHIVEEEQATLEGTEAPKLDIDIAEIEDDDEVEVSNRYDEEELEDIELPELPVKRQKLLDNEVFAPSVKPVLEKQKPKKERKKRKPMTPEQLERLAEGRKKAFAVRAQKKKERDEMKVLEQKVQQKKKQKLEEEIMESLDDEDIPEKMKLKRVPKAFTQSVMPSITHDDLMNAVAQGVETYDRKRKKEKVLKKERLAVEARDDEIKQKVQRAVSVNPWDEFLK